MAIKLLRMLHLGVLLLCSLWASVRAAADGPQEPDIATGRSSGGLRRAAAVSLTGDISEELHKRGAWRNWEGSVECSPRVLATPRSVEEVSDLVKMHERVRAAGLGHSYNDFVCSDDLMLNMIELKKIVHIDKERQTVTVQAGMKTRDLISQLADAGYTLQTFPYFIDQTIGGCVINGAHGSSTKIGSVSMLVRSLKLVTATGAVKVISEGDGDLMEAARVSVGLLGVLVEVTLAVVPDYPVYRDLQVIRQETVTEDLKQALLDPLTVDQLQWCFFPKLGMVARSKIQRVDGVKVTDLNVGQSLAQTYVTSLKDRQAGKLLLQLGGQFMQNPDKRVVSAFLLANVVTLSLLPGRFMHSEALPRQEVLSTDSLMDQYGRYDQYEFAIPFDHMVPCWEELLSLFNNNSVIADDFLVAMLIRFVGEESAFLSTAYGGPRLYLNFDNYDNYAKSEGWSQSFQAIKDLMHSEKCQAHVYHFGKASYSANRGGQWSATDIQEVRDNLGPAWDRFMTIAKHMDPEGKFSDVRGLLR